VKRKPLFIALGTAAIAALALVSTLVAFVVAGDDASAKTTLKFDIAENGTRFSPAGSWTAMIRAETLRWRADRDPDPWTDLAAMWEAESRPYETAYCSMRVAEALLLQGGQRAGERVARAATHLRAAHVIATRLGALTLGDSIRELARAGRVPLEVIQRARQAEPTPPNPYGLSERELDVLRLVADGYSNGEIGRALVISTKTASVHVSNILRKLNVANRVEAAVMAGRMGLAGR
jgi:DNA-binding CsgD family transcriptional regulator